MKSLVQKLLLVGLALVIALPLAAAQKEKKKKQAGPGQVGALKKALSNVELNEEQQKKVDDLIAEYTPKLQAAAKKAGDAPKQLADARKRLSSDGKKGKELAAAVKDAVKLSEEQEAAVKELDGLNGELREKVGAVLTEEQKEKAGLAKKKGKKKNQ